ncbi:MAG: DUF348 domain-containing protein [Anaerolineae bacterium]|nr:DUF348 domain-containing protein [Anaerolineae bacterium]
MLLRARAWGVLLSVLALAWFGIWAYRATGVPVTIDVDGQRFVVHTHRATVADVLAGAGVHLYPEDTVYPAPHVHVRADQEIVVRRARLAQVEADGRTWQVRTQARTLRKLLDDAGVHVSPYDEVRLNGTLTTDLEAPLPVASRAQTTGKAHRWLRRQRQDTDPLVIAIRRAVPIWVHDGGATYVIHSTASTVGEALHREGVTLYLGDLVRPALGTPLTAGLHVYIARSIPFSVRVDGREIHTRTRQQTVADALADLGIVVAGADIVDPPLSARIKPNLTVSITRVRETIEVEQDSIPYATIWVPDDNLEIDRRRVDQAGQEGLTKRRYRVVYHDGRIVSRTLEDKWVAQEPITRVVAYGRKIVLHTLKTPQGTITYWRKIRMLATSYSPSTAGVEPDDPYFGYTRLGWRMRKGVVAVDPTVIKLGSRVYVPGYGIGDAADTGGLIRGRRIDLGFDDYNLELWYRWVDVYLLAPPPPRYQIRWVLPDWPRERRR